MSKITYTEWVAEVFAAYSTHVKKNGDNSQTFYQYIPNHLSEVRPDVYHQVRGVALASHRVSDPRTQVEAEDVRSPVRSMLR